MQTKSERKLIAGRIEAFRVKKGWTWDEVARELDVSKVMLHYVKTGQRSLSSKVLYRLEQAEIAAGLRDHATLGIKPSKPIDHESAFHATHYMQVLKRRWQRRAGDRDQMTLAIRILFSEHADSILTWLNKPS